MKTTKIIVTDATQEMLESLSGVLSNRIFQDVARYLQQAQRGECDFVVGLVADRPVGHCLVYWQSECANFQKQNIPEIVDLIVVEQYRQQGIATTILSNIENRLIEKRYTQVGLSVSNAAKPAKALYKKNGYVLDKSLENGNLMLIKNLLSSQA